MKHFSHEHILVLNESYIAREGDVCRGCNDQIFSCKSFVYSCSRSNVTGSTSTDTSGNVNSECLRFLLHKTCAELPFKMEVQFLTSCAEFPRSLLTQLRYYKFLICCPRPIGLQLRFAEMVLEGRSTCAVCSINWKWFSYCPFSGSFFVCLKCAIHFIQSVEDTKFHHQAHTQHPLVLIQTLSSFKCHACKVEDDIKDLSYKCIICQFWIHKSCADAPTSFLFHFHDKHPLYLTFSLPEIYHRFTQYCKLCYETINRLNWLYYCPKCRFFVHFQCARSNRLLSSSENDTYPNLVHLPATDESSLVEQFVKAMSTLDNDNNSILGTTTRIKDWCHNEHHLQLITITDLHDQKDIGEMLLLCDGCVKPIGTDSKLFYGCVLCKYFLHKVCAELPREIKHHLWPGMKFFAMKCSEPDNFICDVCGNICNGIIFNLHSADIKLHIGCAMLPKTIKHEAHPHQLTQLKTRPFYHDCKACGLTNNAYKHGCKNCDFYVCGGCIIKPRTVTHRWDPHPLYLIYDLSMVMDHEHDFNCELCSSDIDTNHWFYHCSDCDLTFHKSCVTTTTLTQRQYIIHHRHPLILSPSLPEVYGKFRNKLCRICFGILAEFEWIYYCTACDYFMHLDCAITPKDQNIRTAEADIIHGMTPKTSSQWRASISRAAEMC